MVHLLFFCPTSRWKGDLELSFSPLSSSWSMPDPRLLPPPLVFMSQNCLPLRRRRTGGTLFGERWKMGIENFSQKTMTTEMLTRPSHFLPHHDHGQAEPPMSVFWGQEESQFLFVNQHPIGFNNFALESARFTLSSQSGGVFS